MSPSVTQRDDSKAEEPVSIGKAVEQRQRGKAHGYRQDACLTAVNKDKDKVKKANIFKRAWTALDLNIGVLLVMGKGAITPVIALSLFQWTRFAKHYTTLGYLVAITSVLSFGIMPRAKFAQTMIMNILGTCIGSAFALLMTWSGIKAREHTTDARTPPQQYNSSQSAVLATWLFFQIYAVSAIKARFPQLALPSVIYAIFISVAASNGFLFHTTAQCEAFIWKLLQAFLTGFAIGTAVSLFVVPISCRSVVLKQITGYMGLLKGTLAAHKTYLQSLEGSSVFGQTYVPEEEGKHGEPTHDRAKLKPEIAAVKKMSGDLQELHGKLSADVPFAKREVAFGKLTPDDFEAMFKHLRSILIPLLGLGSLMDLFERATEINHWDGSEADHDEAGREQAIDDWNELFKFVHEPFDNLFAALDDGLTHIMLKMELVEPRKKKKGKGQVDVEAKGDAIKPGDEEFAGHLEKHLVEFFSTKKPTLRHFLKSKGIALRDDHVTDQDILDEEELKKLQSITTQKRDQRQLYTLLYVIFLLNAIGRAIIEFVKFADERSLQVSKSKLIWPGGKRVKKWFKSVFSNQDSNQDDETTVAGAERTTTQVNMGDAYKHKRDPEHLPPSNKWEKFGNGIRILSHFFASPESAFGLRCACATMSIAITAFLRETQTFFVEQRLVWALIMVAISMTPTAGQAVFQFGLRILGTFIAVIAVFPVWYIPDQKTAGILVLLFVFATIGFYIPVKRLDLVIVGLISIVSIILIVGYELQVRKIGVQVATAGTNQPAYPIYELAPYRLATVVGGLAVAFFWTIFPYPISEHGALRQKLGAALYLSANLYSIMHEQVMARIRDDTGDEDKDKESPGFALAKARNKAFAKQMLILQGLKIHAGFVKWEVSIGGKFPVDEYTKIIGYLENIVNYTILLGYASKSFSQNAAVSPLQSSNLYADKHAKDAHHTTDSYLQWKNDLRRIIGEAGVTSHEITSLLSLLSSAIMNGQPLPPYLHAPTDYELTAKLESVDRDILSLRHVAEPGYAAFAVMAISTRCINMDVGRLLKSVKKLVGELDFSWHVVSTDDGEARSVSSGGSLRKRETGGANMARAMTLGERMERKRTNSRKTQ